MDDLLDEFLPEVDASPSGFDLALAVVGGLLICWGVLASDATWALLVGILVVCVSAILPMRAFAQNVRARQAAKEAAGLTAKGQVLDVADPAAAALAEVHDAVFETAAALPPDEVAALLVVAHDVTWEAASFLRGRAASTDDERAYLTERARALTALRSELELRVEQRRAAQAPPQVAEDTDGAAQRRVEALRELDALGGPTALSRLQELRDELEEQRRAQE